jgi:hypothetical protein
MLINLNQCEYIQSENYAAGMNNWIVKVTVNPIKDKNNRISIPIIE